MILQEVHTFSTLFKINKYSMFSMISNVYLLIFNVFIYLPYRIYMFHHSANFARIPLTNAGESLVPYCFASSTASLIAIFGVIFSSEKRIS